MVSSLSWPRLPLESFISILRSGKTASSADLIACAKASVVMILSGNKKMSLLLLFFFSIGLTSLPLEL